VQAYLASSKPILAILDGVGAEVVIEAKAGFVAPPGNVAAIAKVIEKILELDKSVLKMMGNNGHKYYKQHFDRNMLIDKLNGWFLDKCKK
jgi:glycosyltransferase involved in cell wall biosynthesis